MPYVPVRLDWRASPPWSLAPETLGQHLIKRRVEQELLQREVAERLDVNTWTYLLWEKDRCRPTVRYYPAILAFLGYDPFPPPVTLAAQIASQRRRLGITIKQAAQLTGVDEGTFARWERGKWKPREAKAAVARFLAL